jgi:AhpD family alkylhydroperoxidase
MYDSANLKKIKTLKELAPEGMAAWATLNEVSMKDGAIPKKYKELMALAVAFTTQCPYCIEVHAKAARAAGCTDAEIAESAVVAAALRAGGAITHATHAIG